MPAIRRIVIGCNFYTSFGTEPKESAETETEEETEAESKAETGEEPAASEDIPSEVDSKEPAYAWSTFADGKLKWAYDTKTKCLTVAPVNSKVKAPLDYPLPWASYRGEITKVIIKKGITKIPDGYFSDYTNLTSVSIPSTVTEIGNYAFSASYNLKTVSIANGVKRIGECAFAGCSSLAKIVIPKSVTTIDRQAFINCTDLASVTLNKGLKKGV